MWTAYLWCWDRYRVFVTSLSTVLCGEIGDTGLGRGVSLVFSVYCTVSLISLTLLLSVVRRATCKPGNCINIYSNYVL